MQICCATGRSFIRSRAHVRHAARDPCSPPAPQRQRPLLPQRLLSRAHTPTLDGKVSVAVVDPRTPGTPPPAMKTQFLRSGTAQTAVPRSRGSLQVVNVATPSKPPTSSPAKRSKARNAALSRVHVARFRAFLSILPISSRFFATKKPIRCTKHRLGWFLGAIGAHGVL